MQPTQLLGSHLVSMTLARLKREAPAGNPLYNQLQFLNLHLWHRLPFYNEAKYEMSLSISEFCKHNH